MESQKISQDIEDYRVKTPLFIAAITKQVKRHAKISIINESKFYESSTNPRKQNKEVTSRSRRTGRSTFSWAYKHAENWKPEKKKETATLADCYPGVAVRASLYRKATKLTVIITVPKGQCATAGQHSLYHETKLQHLSH